MMRILFIFCISVLGTTYVSAVTLLSPDITGSAFADDGAELLYVERFYEQDNGLKVEYLNAADDLIASKVFDYSQSKIAPNYTLIDFRHRFEMGVKGELGQQSMFVHKLDDDSYKQKPVKPALPLIIDAGFNEWVLSSWDSLQEKTIEFNLAFPNRLIMVRMQLAQAACDADWPSHTCFILAADNWLLRKLTGDTLIVFDNAKRRLRYYAGSSNLSDGSNKRQRVKIYYDYGDGL